MFAFSFCLLLCFQILETFSHKLSTSSVISEYISPEIIDEIRKKTSNGLGSQLFCNGKGRFLEGICECYKGFAGEKCQFSDSEMVDYYCNLKGKFNSITRKCDCLMGFIGENCEEISCNGNGILLHEKCYCYKDFMGELCEFKISKDECNNNGYILTKKIEAEINGTMIEKSERFLNSCLCYPGYAGSDCQTFEKPSDYKSIFNFIKKTLLWSDEISSKVCEFGFTGDKCEYNGLSSECNLHGFFHEEDETCLCFENYMGAECESPRYSQFCSSKGYVVLSAFYEKKCLCDKNYFGDRCQFVRCQGNGDFMEGKFCQCYRNYGGENCEIKLVDEECSNYGIMFFDDYGHQRCLCLANYVDDDCIPSRNENITNLTYFLNLQLRKTRPTETKNLLSQFGGGNWSLGLSEKAFLKKLEQRIEINDVFNIEIKKAIDFLNSVKPQYQRILGEYQDFFSNEIPKNMIEAIEKYREMIAKATTPDPECNNHGHRLHYIQTEDIWKTQRMNQSREEIYTIGKTKIAIYFTENTTFEDFLHTKVQPVYEKVICQCEASYSGAYCDIPLIKKDWFSDLSSKIFQENIKKIMEQEEDKAVQKFEEENQINFRLFEKIEKTKKSQQVRFYGIANEQTKFLEKLELDVTEHDKLEEEKIKRKKRKYEIFEFIFS